MSIAEAHLIAAPMTRALIGARCHCNAHHSQSSNNCNHVSEILELLLIGTFPNFL